MEDITRTTQQLSGITTNTQGTHTRKSPITRMSRKTTCTKGRTVYSSKKSLAAFSSFKTDFHPILIKTETFTSTSNKCYQLGSSPGERKREAEGVTTFVPTGQ